MQHHEIKVGVKYVRTKSVIHILPKQTITFMGDKHIERLYLEESIVDLTFNKSRREGYIFISKFIDDTIGVYDTNNDYHLAENIAPYEDKQKSW